VRYRQGRCRSRQMRGTVDAGHYEVQQMRDRTDAGQGKCGEGQIQGSLDRVGHGDAGQMLGVADAGQIQGGADAYYSRAGLVTAV
jgi:hypothetical protein